MTKEGKGLSCKHTRVCIRWSRTHQQSWGDLHMLQPSDSGTTDTAQSIEPSATYAKLLLACRSLQIADPNSR